MMKRTTILALLVLSLTLLTSACGLLRDPEAPSAPIEAVPLDVATETAAPAPEPTPINSPVETEAPAAPTESSAPQAEAPAAGGALIFTIDQSGSQVRFELDEDLRGRRTTVVGRTDQLAGELALDLDDLSGAQVGVVQINARGLATDNSFRNRAIQNEILDTGAYEFITFTPTSIEGLPSNAALGEQVSFTIHGDLTIRDITAPASFAVTARADSETQISGTASAVVLRSDYNLRIPSVPNVANVEEEVELYIDFVATTG